MEDDRVYFRRRASDERAAAMKAAHPKARDAHIQLADRFDDLASSIEHRERYLGLDQDGAQQSA
jgi:hypothetical protein